MTPEQKAAATIIAELETRTDVLDEYRAHPDGDTDFVWVEEGISCILDGADAYTDEGYLGSIGIVFAWLTREHGVTPPRWFLEQTKGVQ